MIDKTTADEWCIKIIPEMEKRNMTLEHVLEYMKFEDECVKHGFTFKSLLAAREHAEPKTVLKTEIAKMRFYKCPVCRDIVDRNQNYCGGCGKRLEWSEEDANV